MDFKIILEDHRIAFHEAGSKTRRGWYNFRCPFCGKDPYMGYNIAGRYVNCWACGRHGLVETVALLTGKPLPDCYALIDGLPREEWRSGLAQTPCGGLKIPDGIGPMSQVHSDYLLKRGKLCREPLRFRPTKLQSLWGIQGLGYLAEPLLRWRLFIPVELDNKVVSWTTRSINGKQPRYRAATDDQSNVSIRDLVYGIDYVRNACIVVEGPVDVWAIGPGAVCLFGTRASPAQMEQLSRVPCRVICFDSEPDAQLRARCLCDDLVVFDGPTTLVQLESGKDAAEASSKELEELRERFLK